MGAGVGGRATRWTTTWTSEKGGGGVSDSGWGRG